MVNSFGKSNNKLKQLKSVILHHKETDRKRKILLNYCKECGKALSDDEKFCSACGTNNYENSSNITLENNKKSMRKKYFVILCIICVIIGIILFLNKNNSDKLDEPVVVSEFQSTTQAGIQYSKNSVLDWVFVKGSTDDDWKFYNPYVKGDYLYIETKACLNSSYTVQYRGFGTASINDTFDKTVPIEYEYENSTVTKGEYQNITIRVPVTDLEEQRPTTLYLRLSSYIDGAQEDIILRISISW